MSQQTERAHLAELLKMGAILKKGGTLTSEHLKTISAAYPEVPMERIVHHAQRINAAPAHQRADYFIVDVASGDPVRHAEAHRLLDSFAGHYEREVTADEVRDTSAQVSARIDANRPKPEGAPNKPAGWKSDTRKAIESAMGQPRAIDPGRIADKLEHGLDVLENPDKVSLRDTLSAAMDTHVVDEAVSSGTLEVNE